MMICSGTWNIDRSDTAKPARSQINASMEDRLGCAERGEWLQLTVECAADCRRETTRANSRATNPTRWAADEDIDAQELARRYARCIACYRSGDVKGAVQALRSNGVLPPTDHTVQTTLAKIRTDPGDATLAANPQLVQKAKIRKPRSLATGS